jgi:phosphoglycolate phosphatase
VATGKSRRGLERSLRHHAEVRQLLVGSRTADETASKPDPLMLRELLEAEDLRAGEALMIGDTDYDMDMAAAIGMPGAAVLCGVHDAERLRATGTAVLLEDVSGLPAWLARP